VLPVAVLQESSDGVGSNCLKFLFHDLLRHITQQLVTH